MQGFLGKPRVPLGPLFVFDTEPLAKPSARMLLHGPVGLAVNDSYSTGAS
jgi:hypothetical protein